MCKNVELHYFYQKTDHGCVFICLFVFFQGWPHWNNGPKKSGEGTIERKINCLGMVFLLRSIQTISGRNFVLGVDFHWRNLLCGGIFQGVGNSRENFTLRGIWENSYTKFFSIVLHYLFQLNFVCGHVAGELSGGYFQRDLIFGQRFYGRRYFRSDRESD